MIYTIYQMAEMVNTSPSVIRTLLTYGKIQCSREKLRKGIKNERVFTPEQVLEVQYFFANREKIRKENREKRRIKKLEDKLVYDVLDDKEDPTLKEILNNPETQWFTMCTNKEDEPVFTGSIVALKRLLSCVNLKTVTDYPYIGFLVMPDNELKEEQDIE